MVTKNRAGKALLSVPKGGSALPPVRVDAEVSQQVVTLTSQGRMLVFPLAEVPQLSRGKGNKLINIPAAAFKNREEFLIAFELVGPGDELLVFAGQRHLRMRARDLAHYAGERARRGRKLPRGFQKADSLVVESKA
jgi:topoisomerase-4 subunit A